MAKLEQWTSFQHIETYIVHRISYIVTFKQQYNLSRHCCSAEAVLICPIMRLFHIWVDNRKIKEDATMPARVVLNGHLACNARFDWGESDVAPQFFLAAQWAHYRVHFKEFCLTLHAGVVEEYHLLFHRTAA